MIRLLRPSSLRARVTWAVLALLAVVLTVLFTAVDLALSARLHADVKVRLTDRAALARQLDGQLGAQQLVDRLRGDGVTAQLCGPGDFGCVESAADPVPPQPHRPGPPGRPGPAAPAPVETAGPVLFVREPLSRGDVLTLSTDTTQIDETVHRLVVLEIAGGLAALAVAGAAALMMARVALRPLDRMTALARHIAAGDRGRRLGVADGRTELGRTAAAFDAMLDELETALASAHAAETRMRAFLGDASHELRTPIAGLRASAEQLVRENPDRAERERIAVLLVREAQRAGRLVDDLLLTARLGHDVPAAGEPVDLIAVAAQEGARQRLLAPSLTFEIDARGDATVDGDPGRLAQVVTNLLDNARHATPDGGHVTVSLRRDGDRVLLEVSDTGPGVPEGDRERIFDRFARGDPGRSRHSGGAGLGLPIARAIAEAHGGRLACPGGTPGGCFRLELPARYATAATPRSSGT
jgi:two-component system OmpR family sensor kinase